MSFRKGDKVVCTDNAGLEGLLVAGDVYTVARVWEASGGIDLEEVPAVTGLVAERFRKLSLHEVQPPSPWKKGDKVVCVGRVPSLTTGQTYTVASVEGSRHATKVEGVPLSYATDVFRLADAHSHVARGCWYYNRICEKPVYCVGFATSGHAVLQLSDHDTNKLGRSVLLAQPADFHKLTALPECTGFDWQISPSPVEEGPLCLWVGNASGVLKLSREKPGSGYHEATADERAVIFGGRPGCCSGEDQ